MDTLHILCYSSKPSFSKKVRETLNKNMSRAQEDAVPGFEVYHLSSLSEVVPTDLKRQSSVLIIDLESFDVDIEKAIPDITDRFINQSLVLVTDQPDLESLQVDHKIFNVKHADLESSLFLAFLYSLANQSDLIASNLEREVEATHY